MGLQKYKRTRWHPLTMRCFCFWMRCFLFQDGCVCIFVKYLQDGFTKIQMHAMSRPWHDDALLFFLDGCVCIFVKYFQDGFIKIQTQWRRWHRLTMRCFCFWMRCFLFQDGCVCIFVKYLQDGFTKIQTHAMSRPWQSTESPIFDAPFRSENGVSCPHERNKIGDSVLWPVTRRRCVAFFPGWMRLYLCKIFARWVYKNTNARDDIVWRCVAFVSGCVAFCFRMDAFVSL